MPANFPTAEQKRYYGRYADTPTPDQLGRHFHLSDTDLFFINKNIYSKLDVNGRREAIARALDLNLIPSP